MIGGGDRFWVKVSISAAPMCIFSGVEVSISPQIGCLVLRDFSTEKVNLFSHRGDFPYGTHDIWALSQSRKQIARPRDDTGRDFTQTFGIFHFKLKRPRQKRPHTAQRSTPAEAHRKFLEGNKSGGKLGDGSGGEK